MSGFVIAQTHIAREGKPTYLVSTVRLSVEHPGGTWFETYIFPSDGKEVTDWGEVWGERYVHEQEARDSHSHVIDGLNAGTLLDWNDEPL